MEIVWRTLTQAMASIWPPDFNAALVHNQRDGAEQLDEHDTSASLGRHEYVLARNVSRALASILRSTDTRMGMSTAV